MSQFKVGDMVLVTPVVADKRLPTIVTKIVRFYQAYRNREDYDSIIYLNDDGEERWEYFENVAPLTKLHKALR